MTSILITGASTGIGEACALRFARAGWTVFAGVRKQADGERLEKQAGVHAVTLDVADEASVEAALKAVDASLEGRPLTALVNNAGIGVGGPVEYISLDEWRHQFEINVFGQLAVTQAALPLIRRAGAAGRVVFIGSIGGRVAMPFIAPYSASKHAIEAIAESMRHELGPFGIRTVLVEPGAVKTPIWDKAQSSADDIEAGLPAEARSRYGQQIVGLRKSMEFQAKTGVEPDVVAKVVQRAVTASKPGARYLVGRDAKLLGNLSRMLPDRLRDRVVGGAVKLTQR